ncbi:MAG: ATP-dependent DNA helicase RecG [Thermoleophilia bacterium]
MRPFAGLELPPSPGRRPPDPARLDRSVDTLKGVGPRLAASLGALGIATVRDLLLHRPRRYEPPAPVVPIGELWGNQEATIEGEVTGASLRRTRRRNLTILEARVRDETGTVLATWFNQAWLAERLVPGTRVRLRGAIERGSAFSVRAYDLDGEDDLLRVLPVYPASQALPSKRLRDLVELALPEVHDLGDPLPAALRARLRLPLKADALVAVHRPELARQAEQGRRRLAFEELLVLQRGLQARRAAAVAGRAPRLGPPGELIARYRAELPFALTGSQEAAVAEIDRDLDSETPMERLLQGDVGSGKTVVALYALLRAVEGGHQGALMAPTETLAEQHFLTVDRIALALGLRCQLLTSSLPGREHAAARDRIATGEIELVVGTHALIQQDVRFRSLGVAVVDEQHRFGVEQRHALSAASGEVAPHRLHMTATPIPRTLALTVWGDLAVSEIAKPPAGRKPIVTRWITHDRSAEAYRRLAGLLEQGRQAYVVCPLVSASESIEARAAEEEAARLRRAELAAFRVGCLHGKLKAQERRSIMDAFSRHELDVLVATTVIEVGVDVPNATAMVVQEADRFGLAQLHQLRGRVGRGSEQSYCLLVSRPKEELTDAAQERLQALVDSTDGFALAEVDLELRGEGQLLGTRQTGLSDLRFTRLRSDRRLLLRAQGHARRLRDDEGLVALEVERLFGDEVRGLA